MAIRLVLLSHHYRSDWEWFDSELVVAQERLQTWRGAFASPLGARSPVTKMVTALSNDLDTPAAIELVDDWAKRTLSGDDSDATTTVADAVDAILGII
jgi:L-cysteine:1D-myo-inositol 2-amino-2-deoxy-alpha-D-glucopyranoside ligase